MIALKFREEMISDDLSGKIWKSTCLYFLRPPSRDQVMGRYQF
jgi:hypothetical protein